MGALTQNLYTMIVTMAVITTMAMPPMLRWALRRLPMSKEEKERLEKEELDAKGFVSQFERLLIAADESANGKFASRLAGFIAGQRGMPVTVQPIKRARKSASVEAAALTTVATEGAKEGHHASGDGNGEPKAERVEVSARVEETAKDAIAKEAPKGYDILFLGVEKMVTQGGFAPEVDRTTTDFHGPIALVFGGEHLTKESGFNVLVPVTGTDTARRGAEIAFAITAAGSGKITAVHVADRRVAPPRSQARRRKTERALVDDLKALAKRYGHDDIMSDVRIDAEPHQAILAEAKASNADLIVLGTNRRIGDHLAVGQTAARVMEEWKGAMIVVVI